MSKYPEYSHTKSREWFERALNVIPSGIYGHLGPSEGLFLPLEKWPLISSKAEGTYFWDMDGNRYIDFMCAYGPNVLGYNDPEVDAAALEQLKSGNCTTAPSYKMVECAELRNRRHHILRNVCARPHPQKKGGIFQGLLPRQRPVGYESRLPRHTARGCGKQHYCSLV